MKQVPVAMLVGLLFLTARPAAAVVTVYDNVTDYNNAVGAELFFIDFDSSPGAIVDGGTISPHVTFGSPEASDPSKVLWNSDALSDAGSTTAPNSVGPLDGVITSPVQAMALEFSSAGNSPTVSFFDSSDVLIDAIVSPNTSGFFGVVSATPIKSFLITNGTFPNGDPDRFFIDDLRANAVNPVPEPSTFILATLGLLSLGMTRRRR